METIVHLNTLPSLYADFADAAEVPVCVPDLSYWQKKILDKEKFLANAHGAILRVGSVDKITGKCYTDYDFHENAKKLQGHLPLGGYWYYRPDKDPIMQADYFCEQMEPYEWHIPPDKDVENNDGGVSMYDFQRWLYKFHCRIEYNTGKVPMDYTRGYFWNDNVGNPEWAGKNDLHIARYTDLPMPWGNIVGGKAEPAKLRPYPWKTWRLWQWSADGNMQGPRFGVGSNSIDLNRYNGTLSEFYAWCNWHQEPVPPVDEPTSTLCEDLKAWVKQCPWKFWEN